LNGLGCDPDTIARGWPSDDMGTPTISAGVVPSKDGRRSEVQTIGWFFGEAEIYALEAFDMVKLGSYFCYPAFRSMQSPEEYVIAKFKEKLMQLLERKLHYQNGHHGPQEAH
jgi:hypothetical protein